MMKATFLAATLVAFLGHAAIAQDAHEHGTAMAGYMSAMDAMMQDMADMPATGDADADFLLMMIPHHQSAIDMAKVVLEQGQDAETRALAEQIIAAQEQEIADMQAMLDRMGVKTR